MTLEKEGPLTTWRRQGVTQGQGLSHQGLSSQRINSSSPQESAESSAPLEISGAKEEKPSLSSRFQSPSESSKRQRKPQCAQISVSVRTATAGAPSLNRGQPQSAQGRKQGLPAERKRKTHLETTLQPLQSSNSGQASAAQVLLPETGTSVHRWLLHTLPPKVPN